MAGVPSTRVVQVATGLRTRLQRLLRRMVPPEIAVLELTSGFMATQAIYAAARLGIPDLLANGPRSATDLAAESGSNADAVYRLLRACATFGLFTEDADGRFGLTPLADVLRSDTADSLRPVVLMLGHPRYQEVWGSLTDTIETGRPGGERVLGGPMWEVLEHDPEFAAAFHDAMGRLTALDWPTVAAVYDFSAFSTIVDIGGGHGQLLALMLHAAPAATGVLFERPGLRRAAEEHLRQAGVLSRCRVEAGSFLESAPAGGDLNVMRRVIHDYDDEQAVAILSNVRQGLPPGATLLLLESVVPLGNTPSFAKILDLDMMLFVGGRERTEAQFRTLLDRAGFHLTRIIPTISTISVIEAVPERQH